MTEVYLSFPRAPGQNTVPLPPWQGQGLEEDDAPVLAELLCLLCGDLEKKRIFIPNAIFVALLTE